MPIKTFAPLAGALAAFAVLATVPAAAQNQMVTGISQVSTHVGEMSASFTAADATNQPRENLMFEPWQMLDDLFRDDIILLMRHGPTDWSKRDIRNVAPTDCNNQRIMTFQGTAQMRDLGILLAANDLRPSEIITSEWCRNRQTVDALVQGFRDVDPEYADMVEENTEVFSGVNLLLSLQGAASGQPLRDRIGEWEGTPEGPRLIVSHFTNIAEVTEFNVYEGEILVIDPNLNNRVLGYVRLRSAAPDVGHFDVDESPVYR